VIRAAAHPDHPPLGHAPAVEFATLRVSDAEWKAADQVRKKA